MAFYYWLTPLIEITIIAIIINYILSFFRNTRFMDLLLCVFAFLLLFALASLFHLSVLHKLLLKSSSIAIIGVLIIFQQDFRIALSHLKVNRKQYKEIDGFDKFLDQLTLSVYRLANKRTGALIALENRDSLDQFAARGTLLNAQFSPELLESLFAESTPLHDGAVIIRELTIVAASVILPLGEDRTQITKSMGTRHRAALGISQITDALLILVSEESGKILIARDGSITPMPKEDRFKGVIRSVFKAPQKSPLSTPFNIKKWFRK